MSIVLLFILAAIFVGTKSFTPQNSHAITQSAESLPKIIDDLLKRVELFDLLQPYIDDYFEKLNFEVITGLNADKLLAISHLRKGSRQAYLIAKSDLLHRFRQGIVHMETSYEKFYQLFVRGLANALNTRARKANASAGNGKGRRPKKSVVAQTNPHAHQHRVNQVVRIVNLFATQYTGEYNKIRWHMFAPV